MERPKKTNGIWEGIEVEATPFMGLETLFIGRYDALCRWGSTEHPHIYIATTECNWYVQLPENRFQRRQDEDSGLVDFVSIMLGYGKKVTVDVSAANEQLIRTLTAFRENDNFCLLITVIIPQPNLYGYAIKIAPPNPFEAISWSRGVYVSSYRDKFVFTPWRAYKDDRDI